VQGNYIGTDVTGSKRLGNKNNGIVISSAPSNVVGGTMAAQRNLISANQQSGVYLLSSGASANWIAGNYIGTDLTGTLAMSNAADGVTLHGASNNLIGGLNAGAQKLISGNDQSGAVIPNGGARTQAQSNYARTR